MTDSIDRVLVAGASGGTGREVMRRLEGSDVTLRALTSSPGNADPLAEAGADEVTVGDLRDPTAAARAVRGVDLVVSTVGSSPRAMLSRGGLVDGVGVENLVAAAVAADVSHFTLESSIGVGNSAEAMPGWFRTIMKRILRAKAESERTLRTAGVPYTTLRPGRLTDDEATEDILVGEGGTSVAGAIPRADVARSLLAAAFTPAARNRTFEVVSRAGQRGEPGELVAIEWANGLTRG